MIGSKGMEAAEFEIARLHEALTKANEEIQRLKAFLIEAGWGLDLPPVSRETVMQIKAQRDHYYNACVLIAHEIDQVLGRALGMVLKEEDRPELIGAKVGDVFTGIDTPETLADLAAKRIRELEEENHKLRDLLQAYAKRES